METPKAEIPAFCPEQAANAEPDYWHWRIEKKKAKRGLIRLVIWTLGVAVCIVWPFSIGLEVYERMTARSRFSYILASLKKAQDNIEAQLKANPRTTIDPATAHLIPSRFSVRLRSREEILFIRYKAVAPDGAITAFSSQTGVLFVLRPKIRDGEVEWSCWGSSSHPNDERIISSLYSCRILPDDAANERISMP
jgi:hypothetical protein